MLPQRPSGSPPFATTGRKSGPITFAPVSFDVAKMRVLAKLEERLGLGASKRMPPSLLRQSLRQHAEQITDQEARGLAKSDRDRLVEEVLRELLGYGPLEELFGDPGVREVMVTGPNTVIARRELGQWLPTSVKFRDEAHVRATLDRIAAQAEPVGPVMASVTLFDVRLPNGFRALALIPPDALGQPAAVSFVREPAVPVPAPARDAAAAPPPPPPAPAAPGSQYGLRLGPVAPPSRSGSGPVAGPGSRAPSEPPSTAVDPLARHRSRILERLLSRFAALKVYDVSRVEVTELRKVIAAYVREYTENEKVYLSDADQGRLMLEILTAFQR